jgi:signal transduction histidine kinase
VTGPFARFYPASLGLAARIGLIVIGAVALSVGISTVFIFFLGQGNSHPPSIPAARLAKDMLALYRRIDAAPAGERAGIEPEAPILRITWPAPPPPPGFTPPPGYLGDLQKLILDGLPEAGRGVGVDVGFPSADGGTPPGPPPQGSEFQGQQQGQPMPPPPPGSTGGGGGIVTSGSFGVGGGPFGAHGLLTFGPTVRAKLQLGDGSWLSLEASQWQPPPFPLIDFLTRVIPVTAVSLILFLWLARGFARPIVRLAEAAERLGIEGDVSMLQETGAPEMRAAARVFNQMQLRLRRLIDDRTQMLAAISHDLKTPITRLRLRAEFIEDASLQEKMLADLAEMESIVASTLAFARSDARSEASEPIDLADMLQSLAEARADCGAKVTYEGPAHLTVRVRPVALRRALGNLVDNALKYGESARLALSITDKLAVVTIEDEGPGIPVDQRELVFRPYYRLEGSRSRETGGVGLGLTIARAAIRAEGGDIELGNGSSGGLVVRVTLPLDPAAYRIASAS